RGGQPALPADGLPVRAVAAAVDAAGCPGAAGAGLAVLPPRPARAEGGWHGRGAAGRAASRRAAGGDLRLLRPGACAPGAARLMPPRPSMRSRAGLAPAVAAQASRSPLRLLPPATESMP